MQATLEASYSASLHSRTLAQGWWPTLLPQKCFFRFFILEIKPSPCNSSVLIVSISPKTGGMEQPQEQEPFLPVKEHDEDSRSAESSSGPSVTARSSWKPSRTNLMIHAILISLYTVCSLVAVLMLREPYPRSCNHISMLSNILEF